MVEQTKFDAPGGTDPVALDFSSMGKGQAWVNGHHVGRYWTLVAPNNGCGRTCDYRGAYHSDKCRTNCGEITQAWYELLLLAEIIIYILGNLALMIVRGYTCVGAVKWI